MRTSATALCVLVLSALHGRADAQTGQWTRTYPAALASNVDVTMLSGLEGWVADAHGGVHHTTSGGIFWTDYQVPTDELRALCFRGFTGWAAGNGLFRSNDNGQTWSQVSSATGIEDVFFSDTLHGWAVGSVGRTWRSTDGGLSWTLVTLAGVGQSLRAVHFIDATNGWLVGDGARCEQSSDGGQSWTALSVPSSANFSDVYFSDALHGWIAAGDHVWRTSDGGANWTGVLLPSAARADRLSVLGGNWLWATGSAGKIARSVDAGASWSVPFSAGLPLFDVALGDLGSGLACGVDGRTYRTTDGGTSWTLVHGGSATTSRLVMDVCRQGANLVWAACTDSTILRSTDGGSSWTEITAGLAQINYRALDFFDDQNGFAVGKRQGFYPTTAWTSDGGLNWNATYWSGMYDIVDVDALDAQTAIACTTSGIWRTTNHGVGWTTIPTAPYYDLFAADFIDAQHGWAVGYDVLETIDGGLSWTHRAASAVALRDVSFADASDGWAVGDSGTIRHTGDGGQTWSTQAAGLTNASVSMVSAVSPLVVWVAGTGGFVARTLDGGTNWTTLAPADAGGTDCYGATFDAQDHGLLAGYTPVAGIWRRDPPGCGWTNFCQGKLNSAGTIASLSVVGVPSVGQSPFEIHVTAAVPNKLGMMLRSATGPASTPFYGGVLCLAAPITRMGVQAADASGELGYLVPVDPGMVGTTRWYQFWQRDPQNPDGTAIALSDGVAVSFCQ